MGVQTKVVIRENENEERQEKDRKKMITDKLCLGTRRTKVPVLEIYKLRVEIGLS